MKYQKHQIKNTKKQNKEYIEKLLKKVKNFFKVISAISFDKIGLYFFRSIF